MFSADVIALALTVGASAIPILGKALALRLRKGKLALKLSEVKKDADLPQPIAGPPPEIAEVQFGDLHASHVRIEIRREEAGRDDVNDGVAMKEWRELPYPASVEREIPRAAPVPREIPRAASVPRFVLTALVAALISTLAYFFTFGLQYKSTISSDGGQANPQSGIGFLTLVSWLSRHEVFYQFMFLFTVFLVILLNKRRIATLTRQLDASGKLLLCFAGVVLCFGGSAGIHFWNQISVSGDKMYLALGLLLTMVAGMFVQVITSNYKAGASSLFAVTTAELIYPVLFSPIVYYAIWAVASASSSAGVFSFYAAFLNGYFWQSVVTSAQKASAASGTA
jgi:hypothetical protein